MREEAIRQLRSSGCVQARHQTAARIPSPNRHRTRWPRHRSSAAVRHRHACASRPGSWVGPPAAVAGSVNARWTLNLWNSASRTWSVSCSSASAPLMRKLSVLSWTGVGGEEPAAASVRTTFFAQRVAGDGPMIAMRGKPTRRSGPLSGSMWLSSLNETTACRSPACHCHRPCWSSPP